MITKDNQKDNEISQTSRWWFIRIIHVLLEVYSKYFHVTECREKLKFMAQNALNIYAFWCIFLQCIQHSAFINQSLHVFADKRSYINVISVMNTHDLSFLHTIYNSLTRVVVVDNWCENAMSYILPSNICPLQQIPINVTKSRSSH